MDLRQRKWVLGPNQPPRDEMVPARPTLFIKIWTMRLSRIVHILFSRGDGELTEGNVRGQVLDPSRHRRTYGAEPRDDRERGSGFRLGGRNDWRGPTLHSVLETLRLRSRHGASSTGRTEYPVSWQDGCHGEARSGHGNDGGGWVLRLLILRSSCGGPSRGGCSTFSGLTPEADPPQAAVPSPAA